MTESTLNLVVLEILGFGLYAGILGYVWRQLSNSSAISNILPTILLLAICLHGYISYLNIDGGTGHDFGLFNIFAMTTWLSMIIVYWNLVKHQSHALLLISLPIAAVSLLEVAIFDGMASIEIPSEKADIWHILLGILSMSILMLAAMQSLLVLYVDNGLRHHPASIHAWLGPLQSLERYLIQLLIIGFLFMSVSLLLALSFSDESIHTQPLHKILLTILSWVILATLLFGHFIRGWRGVFAAKLTLVGVFLLLLGYFGSKLVLEFIL